MVSRDVSKSCGQRAAGNLLLLASTKIYIYIYIYIFDTNTSTCHLLGKIVRKVKVALTASDCPFGCEKSGSTVWSDFEPFFFALHATCCDGCFVLG